MSTRAAPGTTAPGTTAAPRTTAAPGGAAAPRGLTVVVTGASGTLGREAAALLAPGHHVRALTRDPARAAAGGLAGQVIGADFADRASLARACEGADALLVITSDPLRPDHDDNVLAAARAGGVRHVVKVSALAVTDPDADDLVTRWQRENEERVRASGMAWTLLRPRAFMSKTRDWAPSIARESVVRALHGDSRNACVDPRDVSAVAARVLTEPGHAGRAYALTGPAAVSARDQCRELAAVLGRPLRFVGMTVGEAVDAWRARHPEPLVQALLEMSARQAAGGKADVAHGVADVLGRPPAAFAAWARDHAAVFRDAV
ncbi:NAD(P)H-binding protein [Streptomyces sp. NPDC051310]|uniref:NAD(P)H-binding protein n=1 Tax=Streptomyces sp. NPDC051310 TaxID=3365649 RepID=UPI0037A213C6